MKLSIITINLNNATGLLKTIESILTQTFTEFELLVIDGGSTEENISIIRSYANKIKYWITEPDNGIYNAMNKGIRQAKGDYCFFLNSGDYFANEFVLENIFAKEYDKDVIFGNLLVWFNNKFVGKSIGKEKLSFLDIYGSTIKHQATFIRKDLFIKFGFYNEKLRIVADWEFFIKTIGLGGASYKYLDIDISCFDNNGISNNSSDLIAEEKKIVIETFLPAMMRSDYEFMLKYGNYKIITKYRLTYLLLRIMAKGIKVFDKITYRR